MELRCPECASPEVERDPQGGAEAQHCGNCGARIVAQRIVRALIIAVVAVAALAMLFAVVLIVLVSADVWGGA